MITRMCRWSHLTEKFERDLLVLEVWDIPEDGVEIEILHNSVSYKVIPLGDGMYVMMNGVLYHINAIMKKLTEVEMKGYTWSMKDVEKRYEEYREGKWVEDSMK